MPKFINPYIFINLPEKRDEADKSKGNLTGKIQCSIYPRTHLFIPNTTNSDVLNVKNDHKNYDFYSYNDLTGQIDPKCSEPVIPGSSIRGEIRSLYEALTNSCFSTVTNDKILYKRMPNPGEAGVLAMENDRLILYKAKKYMACYIPCQNDNCNKKFNGEIVGKHFNKSKLSEGQKVFFKADVPYRSKRNNHHMPCIVTEICTCTNPATGYTKNFKEGYVLKGEPFSKKHHFSIIEKSTEFPALREVLREEKEMLEQVLDSYDDPKINKAKEHKHYIEYSQKLKEVFEKGGEIPVFYKDINKSLYLSPACISKEVYKNKISSLLKNGNYNPCNDESDICPACHLFGSVRNTLNVPGRLRFSDARIDYNGSFENLFEDYQTLKELSSPKLSSTEFYLQHPNFDYAEIAGIKKVSEKSVKQEFKSFAALQNLQLFDENNPVKSSETVSINVVDKSNENKDTDMWNYDFAFTWHGNKQKVISGYKPRIKGRKFYWQHKNHCLSHATISEQSVKSDKNSTVRLLKPCGKDGDKNNPDYCFRFTIYFENLSKDELNKLIAVVELDKKGYHSIGHGKPLGLGSARISVDEVMLREIYIKDDKIIRDGGKIFKHKTQPLTEAFAQNKPCAKQVEVITSLHDFGSDIEYPALKKGDMIFKWFSNNRGKNNSPKIKQFLHNIQTVDMNDKTLENSVALDRINGSNNNIKV